ncbi:MAG TPA: FAD-binding dehydrogenase [Chloroflexota bacterium]|nr:FAD-binding dehydrogenase [Chloroflexota bacterium]
MNDEADVIVIGAGLTGLVATAEAVAAGRRVILLEQEPRPYLGGQAFWSLGGLFLVNSPEQRRFGIPDSYDLALRDWMRSAAFDRDEDLWPRRWAEAYVAFASGEKRLWLRKLGVRFFPVVGWAERGAAGPTGCGNSVPRFHVTWGTGPGVVAPFERLVRDAEREGQVSIRFRHRVDELSVTSGAVDGVRGHILDASCSERGEASSRVEVGEFSLKADAVVVASGGIGGDHDLVRQAWPERLGRPPHTMLSGVPEHVDGRMLAIAEAVGGRIINRDRMWHYTEGVENWNPIWRNHGIRILPGPSSLWLDAAGIRLPSPLFPGYDTLGTLTHIRATGHDHTWFILNQRIIKREFALSGSEQNPDLTGKSLRLLAQRVLHGRSAPLAVEAFKRSGADFIVGDRLDGLARRMNELAGTDLIDPADLRRLIEDRDLSVQDHLNSIRPAVARRQAEQQASNVEDHLGSMDPQVLAIHDASHYIGDRLTRVAKLHRLLDPNAGPLIGVRLRTLTRKTLGGLQTDLGSRVLNAEGAAVPGLFAAGEAAGFGGGGMHGYRALEGTFLGGCLFSGRAAGRAAAGKN